MVDRWRRSEVYPAVVTLRHQVAPTTYLSVPIRFRLCQTWLSNTNVFIKSSTTTKLSPNPDSHTVHANRGHAHPMAMHLDSHHIGSVIDHAGTVVVEKVQTYRGNISRNTQLLESRDFLGVESTRGNDLQIFAYP